MKNKLDSSLRRSRILTNSYFTAALILYLVLPSLVLYLFFFSKNASASNESSFLGEMQIEIIESSTNFNTITKPYESVFGLNIVKILDGEEEIPVLTQNIIVQDILNEQNISYDSNDIVLPALDETVPSESVIRVIEVDENSKQETEAIPFSTIYEEDPTLPDTYKKITQEGSDGLKLKKYSLRYENGDLISKTLISEEILVAPTPQKIVIGTKPSTQYDGPNSCTYWDSVIDKRAANKEEADWVKHIMRCESACNTFQVSRDGSFYGLMQFLPSTFYKIFHGTDIFNGNEQIEFTISIYRMGYSAMEKNFSACNP